MIELWQVLSSWIKSLKHSFIFFFNYTATTEIYTLSLHDALPILSRLLVVTENYPQLKSDQNFRDLQAQLDRKSTRLNSSHITNSYAVFGLKKTNLNTMCKTEVQGRISNSTNNKRREEL